MSQKKQISVILHRFPYNKDDLWILDNFFYDDYKIVTQKCYLPKVTESEY